jgi:MFS family permease
LFRSVPLATAIVMAVFALCGFQAFLFVSTLYLQDVRGLSPMRAGLCLLPVGILVLILSPVSGRMVAAGARRRPLLIAGVALAAGGAALLWLTPDTALPLVIATYLLIGVFLGLVNPPITNTAVSGLPRSMAGLAAALASSGRQTGTTLGVAIAGAILGRTAGQSGSGFTRTAHGVWWMVVGLGLALVVMTLISTNGRAERTAGQAAALFADPAPDDQPVASARASGTPGR